MDLALYLLAFAMFWKSTTSIQCYQCVAEQAFTLEHPCANFDRSSKFIVNCPNSNMCYKRVSTLDFGNGLSTETFQRGCALQTKHGDQIKVDHKWVPVTDIQEAYEEGCQPDLTNADRVTKTTHCYCRGDLCNGAHRTIVRYANLLAVIIVCLVIVLT